MRVRKYLAGERINHTSYAVDEILAGRYLMVNGKPTHPGWAGAWSVNLLNGFVRMGHVQYADINPAWKPKETDDL